MTCKIAGNSKFTKSVTSFKVENNGVLSSNKLKNNTKSRVSTFKFSEDSKFRERWGVKMNQKLNQNKHSRIYAAHFTENCIKQNLSVRRFLGSAFKSLRLALKRMQSQRLFDQKIKYGEECPPKNKLNTAKNASRRAERLHTTVRSSFA